jgi:hypothetical protein
MNVGLGDDQSRVGERELVRPAGHRDDLMSGVDSLPGKRLKLPPTR